MEKTNSAKADFTLAYIALRQGLLGFINKHVCDPTIGEDLLQEVFLKAIKASETNSTPDNLTGWLYGIAKNTLIDYYRSKRPNQPLSDNLIAETIDDPKAEMTINECLRPMIKDLPDLYKDTLLGIYFENKTLQTIADQEKISLSAIKSRALRGREILKMNLLDCCQIELSRKGEILDVQKKGVRTDCQSNACK